MENQKKPEMPADESWFDELLTQPELHDEIGPDEQAVSSAGLTHPDDAELEQIINEAKNMGETIVLNIGEPGEVPEVQESDLQQEPRELPEAPFLDEEYRNTFGEKGEALEGVFGNPALEYQDLPQEELPAVPEPIEEAPQAPVRKGRPRMKKGYGLLGIPHIISTAIWLAITLVIGISLGRLLWLCASDVLAFGRESNDYTVTITESDNIDTIAGKLKSAGLIRYPKLFKLYAELTDAEEEISVGTFTLNSRYDYHALVNYMAYHAPSRLEVEVLIPEGYTCAQIFTLLEEKGVCSVEKLEAYATDGELGDYWFLEGVARGHRYSLEGYLFPDTYRFYTNDDPENVLEKMLDNFDYRFTDVMKEKIEPLNARMAAVLSSRGYTQEYIDAHRFTIRDIVTIASMIEKETANDAESYEISSVIYNRLTNPKDFPYLNIDATIIYALGGNIDPETGNTKPLTSADLAIDHPYNSYTNPGMIPGPISNPGRNSLNAALDPNETKYYFYVYNPQTSLHLFATDAAGHDKNVNYVRSLG